MFSDILRYSLSYIKDHRHWLPISNRIEYKVLIIVLQAQMGVVPKYLRDAIRLPTSASSLHSQCHAFSPTGVSITLLHMSIAFDKVDDNIVASICIVLYCIVSINLYSASCSAHQSEALPVRETQREESKGCRR